MSNEPRLDSAAGARIPKSHLSLEILAVLSVAGTILVEGNVPNKATIFPLVPITIALLQLKSPFKRFQQTFGRLPWIVKLLSLLLPINEILRSLSEAESIYDAVNVATAVRLVSVVGSLVILIGIDSKAGRPKSLYIIGISSFVTAAVNIVAHFYGYSLGGLRTDVEHTSYSADARLVTLITPGWYLSGELRWAIPLLLIFSIEKWVPIWVKGISWTVAPIALYVVKELGYRGAIFCAAFGAVWYLLVSSRLREIWSKIALIYCLVTPFVWTSSTFEELIPDLIPRWIYDSAIIGRQEVSSVLELSGRTAIWRQGFDALLEGNCLFVGNGLSYRRNLEVIGEPQFSNDARQGTTLPLHQGPLEWVFAYGLAFAIVLLLGLVDAIRMLPKQRHLMRDRVGISNRDIALLSLGLCGIANSQDGYFVLDQYFWLVLIVTVSAGYLGSLEVKVNERVAKKNL